MSKDRRASLEAIFWHSNRGVKFPREAFIANESKDGERRLHSLLDSGLVHLSPNGNVTLSTAGEDQLARDRREFPGEWFPPFESSVHLAWSPDDSVGPSGIGLPEDRPDRSLDIPPAPERAKDHMKAIIAALSDEEKDQMAALLHGEGYPRQATAAQIKNVCEISDRQHRHAKLLDLACSGRITIATLGRLLQESAARHGQVRDMG
jgi:hypothetical protein